MRKKWCNNVGFTLVELIVTMTIMVIVGGAITSFVVTAQRNYNYGSAETDLQYEAQLVVNQLQDLMIDSARGISYTFDGTLADGSTASNANIFADTDTSILGAQVVDTKSLYIYDETEYYALEWNQAQRKIYFSSFETNGTPIEQNQLLAEFVTGFSVDLRDISGNNTVKYILTLEKEGSGKTYTTSHKIKLRNEVLVNADLADIYVPGEGAPVADKILLNPSSIRLWPGESANVSASVISSTGGIPSQNVMWKVTGLAESTTYPDGIDMSVMQSVLSTPGAGTGIFTLNENEGLADPNKIFRIYAEKTLAGGTTITSDNFVEGQIRDITGVTAKDNKERLSGESNVSLNKLAGEEVVSVTATIGGTHIDDLETSDMGGLKITISATDNGSEVEYSNYIEEVTIDENNGKVKFKVKNGVRSNDVVISIRFQVKKPNYTSRECVMQYSLQGAFDVDIADDNWKREGVLQIKVQDINPDWIIIGQDGKKYLNNAVNVTFRFYDSKTGLGHQPITMSNNVNSGNEHTQENANVKLTMDYQGDYLNIGATLLSTTDFAFSYPYYGIHAYESYPYGVDKVDITVTINGQSVTRTLNVEPVSFGYGAFEAEIAEAGDNWEWKNTIRLYATDEVKTVTAYYSLLSGWAAGDTSYSTDASRYIGIIGDAGDNKKYQFKNTTDGQSGSGKHCVTFTLNDAVTGQKFSQMVGKTVTVKYEYNPYFGGSAPSGYEQRFAEITGCDGSVEIAFVNKNVVIDQGKRKPTVSYCPAPGDGEYDLKKDTKHYISETQRYVVEKYDDDNTTIKLQIYEDGMWKEAWPGYVLKWDASDSKWKMELKNKNVIITDDRTEPSVLYCPSPEEMRTSSEIYRDRYWAYYFASNTECYAMYLDTGELYFVKLVNGKWIDNVWGDATLTWNSELAQWEHPASNMKLKEGMVKPSIPYCPSTDEWYWNTYEIHYLNSNYCDEYFQYDRQKQTITYVKNGSKVWGNTKLVWDDDQSMWIPFETTVNVVITDKRVKYEDNYEYCPAPDSNYWNSNNRYYLDDDQKKWYALSNDKKTISYRTGSYNSQGTKEWGDDELYWDSNNSVWTNHPQNIVLDDWGTPSIPYCPSPVELKNDSTLIKKDGGKKIKYCISGDQKNYYYYNSKKGELEYYVNDKKVTDSKRYWSDTRREWVLPNIKVPKKNDEGWKDLNTRYCPEPSTFDFSEQTVYHKFNEDYRAVVSRQGNSNSYVYSITLQENDDDEWSTIDDAKALIWNEDEAVWSIDNIIVPDNDTGWEELDEKYCPAPSEFTFGNEDVYYKFSDKYRVLVGRKSNGNGNTYTITLQYYGKKSDGTGSKKWRNYSDAEVLTWNESNQKWQK